MSGWPTTRRHPRTLAEAFPVERAEWIEPPEPRQLHRLADVAMLAVAIVAVLLLIAGRLA